MKNKVLTIVLMCAIVYCTTNNPVIGDDNNTVDPVIITGTEKYKYTSENIAGGVTYYYNEGTRVITGELEKHRAYTDQCFDKKGRKGATYTYYSDGSSYIEQYDTTGAVTFKSKTVRID